MAFSLDNTHIAVTYHYVEDPRFDAGGIRPCSVAEFERQIRFLAERFQFASVPEVYEAAKRGSVEKLCAVTFDDGLQDQWENAIPILKHYGVLATFFIITGTFDGKMPSAHKIHMISSRISMHALVEKFNSFVLHAFPDFAQLYHIPLDRFLTNKRRHDDILPANFKEMVNNIAPRAVSDAFLSEMLKELDMKEDDECKKLFMNPEQIRTLPSMGFFVEHHTHNHYSLDREPIEVLREDFGVATHILKGILGKFPRVMAYPYGRAPIDHAIFAEYGITHGVTVENRSIIAGDDAFLIPRFDTNDIKIFLDSNG